MERIAGLTFYLTQSGLFRPIQVAIFFSKKLGGEEIHACMKHAPGVWDASLSQG